MDHFVMDTERRVLLVTTSSFEAACYHADLLLPDRDYLINEWTIAAFATFSNWELELLYANTAKVPCPAYKDRMTLVGLVLLLRATLVDETPVEALRKRLGCQPSQPSLTHSLPPVTRPAGQPRATATAPAPGRPKPGTTTARVWDFCDTFVNTNGRLPTRAELAAGLNDINPSTLSVQFSHWKKASEK